MADIALRHGWSPGLLGWIIAEHGRYYDRDWRLGPVFEAKVAQGLGELVARLDPARDMLLAATDGATVVGAGSADEHTIVLTVTDAQTAKVTDGSELPLKGRATGGVRITKFRHEQRLEWAYVGPEQGVLLVVGAEDSPSRPDASPEPLTIPHTARDLVSKATRRRFLAVGIGRW